MKMKKRMELVSKLFPKVINLLAIPPAVLVTVNYHFQLARNSNFYSLSSQVIDVATVVFESNPFVQRLAESQIYFLLFFGSSKNGLISLQIMAKKR